MKEPYKQHRVSMTMPDGTRKFYSGRTQKEAEEKRDKDKLLLGRGIDICSKVKFKTLCEAWLTDYKSNPALHVRTIETTEGIFNRYILPELGEMLVTQIKPINIDMMMAKFAHLGYGTQKKILNYTRNIFVLAIDNELIVRSPVSEKKRPKGEKTEEVEPLTDEQCEKLLSATKGTRVYNFLMVLRYCGLRKGEALGLMWNDIDFDKKLLHVQRSIVYTLNNRAGEINPDLKTKKANRFIPIPDVLLDVLKRAKEETTSLYVFSMENGNFLSEASFRRMWDLIKYRSTKSPHEKHFNVVADIDFDVHPHQLRHTYATKLISSGVSPKEAQYLLGHATANITMNIYTHYMVEQQISGTAEKISNIFGTTQIEEKKEVTG